MPGKTERRMMMDWRDASPGRSVRFSANHEAAKEQKRGTF